MLRVSLELQTSIEFSSIIIAKQLKDYFSSACYLQHAVIKKLRSFKETLVFNIFFNQATNYVQATLSFHIDVLFSGAWTNTLNCDTLKMGKKHITLCTTGTFILVQGNACECALNTRLKQFLWWNNFNFLWC